jgi:hypothetical protein
MCTNLGMLSADGLTWLKRNSYHELYKCSSGCNNVHIYIVLGIISTRLDKIGKAMYPLYDSYNQPMEV